MQSFLEIDRWVVYERETRPAHCVPCNFFGGQREIYLWIGLFRAALFFLQRGAFSVRGKRSINKSMKDCTSLSFFCLKLLYKKKQN